MKTLYLDIFSGISGDMLIGALIDLGVEARVLEAELRKLSLEGWHLHVARAQKMGISGVKCDVHEHAHKHRHTHEHSHGELTHTHEHAHTHAHAHEHEREHNHEHAHDYGSHNHEHEHEHGPHGGPMVLVPKSQVEISVFERNVPPRFRLYFFDRAGKAVKPLPAGKVALETVRAGNQRQMFRFKLQGDFLEATDELPEPHEFKAILRLQRTGRPEKFEIQFVEDHEHHGHTHTHEHGQSRNFRDIKKLIRQSALSDWVKQKSIAVFERIAIAEGKIHGQPPEQVHFHEVGAVDSIVDIVGACVALEKLGKPRVLASAVVEGTGWIHCAHGRFPIPAPATLAILGARGASLTQCNEPHELVTPTGAALLAEFVERFGPMQGLVAEKIGFGLGTRDNQTRPNVLRAILGSESKVENTKSKVAHDWESDTVAVVEANLDDINPEILGHFVEKAIDRGALDVFHTPIQMKKNRPGVLLTVLCAAAEADSFAELILRETTSFGVRRHIAERRKLRREFATVRTQHGEVKIKLGKLDGRVVQASPEFESCKKLAEQKQVTLKDIYDAANKAIKAEL
jgi:uncharacterized protein (TIGR00299 family) protein